MKKQRLLLGISMAALIFSADCIAQDAKVSVPLYHATYSIGRNDFRIGSANFSLIQNKDGTYTYTSVSKATGLAALFVNDTVTETSRFKLVNGKLQSLQYAYEHTGNDKDKKDNIQFEWDKNVAHSEDGGKQHTLPIKSGTYDRLLAQLAISMDLQAGWGVEDYPVLNHNEIKVYHLLRRDNTDLKTPAGTFETVMITRRDPHKDRVTTFWLAPKLDYLPVQMEQTEPGKATVSLVLTEIHFDKDNFK
ncbi:MAG TPA: DUF3108 domain-containing protein [Gammaproteobacteria bacterium]|nr:DUF3108 domain-containing protein [Gammaproteobacteria bacterium]